MNFIITTKYYIIHIIYGLMKCSVICTLHICQLYNCETPLQTFQRLCCLFDPSHLIHCIHQYNAIFLDIPATCNCMNSTSVLSFWKKFSFRICLELNHTFESILIASLNLALSPIERKNMDVKVENAYYCETVDRNCREIFH